ncbi:uncharacterized protein [Diadema setosum]|uniref:uncharacterized protein n=1 Tax=Diadema setosum TaxID=31175 RepID=UPI003B3AEFEE
MVPDLVTKGQVSTKPVVTAYWGKSVELPCEISRPPLAVLWFQHTFIGAPDNEGRVVVEHFDSENIEKAGQRFEITSNFSLMIHNVSVQDETTYSCLVTWFDDQVTNYTDLRVIVSADDRSPITVDNCLKNDSGKCVYYIDPSESTIQLRCKVVGVRPAVNLTWTDPLTGEVVPSGKTYRDVVVKTGLITVYRDTQVSASDTDQDLICQANGEADIILDFEKGCLAAMVTLIGKLKGLGEMRLVHVLNKLRCDYTFNDLGSKLDIGNWSVVLENIFAT